MFFYNILDVIDNEDEFDIKFFNYLLIYFCILLLFVLLLNLEIFSIYF